MVTKEQKKEKNKIWRENNPNYQKEYEKVYYENKENKDKRKEYQKRYNSIYSKTNKYKESKNNWIKNNKEKINKRREEYRKSPENKERFKLYYEKEMKKTNSIIKKRLRVYFRKLFKYYLKKDKKFSSKKYGIDFEKIIEHLKPFPEDISKYHIDHIKPLCSFNFIKEDGSTNLEEVKLAFSPENLQWLTIKENLFKGRKYEN